MEGAPRVGEKGLMWSVSAMEAHHGGSDGWLARGRLGHLRKATLGAQLIGQQVVLVPWGWGSMWGRIEECALCSRKAASPISFALTNVWLPGGAWPGWPQFCLTGGHLPFNGTRQWSLSQRVPSASLYWHRPMMARQCQSPRKGKKGGKMKLGPPGRGTPPPSPGVPRGRGGGGMGAPVIW